ncbi:MAG: glutaredoxin family protein [Methylococcales bacterium]
MQTTHSKFILYGTEGCHLCDEARDLLDLVLSHQGKPIDYPYIDIADDDQLLELYGESIPVIKMIQSSKEIGWPFDYIKLIEFLNNP